MPTREWKSHECQYKCIGTTFILISTRSRELSPRTCVFCTKMRVFTKYMEMHWNKVICECSNTHFAASYVDSDAGFEAATCFWAGNMFLSGFEAFQKIRFSYTVEATSAYSARVRIQFSSRVVAGNTGTCIGNYDCRIYFSVWDVVRAKILNYYGTIE